MSLLLRYRPGDACPLGENLIAPRDHFARPPPIGPAAGPVRTSPTGSSPTRAETDDSHAGSPRKCCGPFVPLLSLPIDPTRALAKTNFPRTVAFSRAFFSMHQCCEPEVKGGASKLPPSALCDALPRREQREQRGDRCLRVALRAPGSSARAGWFGSSFRSPTSRYCGQTRPSSRPAGRGGDHTATLFSERLLGGAALQKTISEIGLLCLARLSQSPLSEPRLQIRANGTSSGKRRLLAKALRLRGGAVRPDLRFSSSLRGPSRVPCSAASHPPRMC